MPTYEFRCPQGHEFEKFYRSISGAEAQATCPICDQQSERMMSATGFAFKGSGFYLTDYGKNAHRDKGTQGAAGEGAKADGAKAEGAKSESGSSESKGESKGESKSDSGAKSESSGTSEPKKAAAPAETKPAAAAPKKSNNE